ncbi:hypothetical protein CDO51_00200 [Natranaerobius trueperi]|uniref:Uncharacterized protein n=1 Tax=Natranaerobius trueperi TaxID=759412 RepID=A0A226C2L4_9FIRM|nr:hypothetical protein CDO51_00200 [Natranaerobius trueperi]
MSTIHFFFDNTKSFSNHFNFYPIRCYLSDFNASSYKYTEAIIKKQIFKKGGKTMSKLRIALLTGLFTVLSQIAVTSTASASLMIAYQPKLPKSLR